MNSLTIRSAALCALILAPLPAVAEVPAWLSGEWRTAARLTAPDGAQIRIRCTMDASANGETWIGTLGCATVQGRFEGRWTIAIPGATASGNVVFSGTETADLSVSGPVSDTRVDLRTSDGGQGVAFAPGTNGALVVEMDRLGPQRLTGQLSFETR